MGVSLCMIARNEAGHIAACLDSVRSLVQEIVVVDTGSTDATVHIARARGARVSTFAWCDDFAAARNASIERASHPWIVWMDADDRLDRANQRKLARLFQGLGRENGGYLLQCASLGPSGVVKASIRHLRLFRNDKRIRWERRVHEQIAPAILRAGGENPAVGRRHPPLRIRRPRANPREVETKSSAERARMH